MMLEARLEGLLDHEVDLVDLGRASAFLALEIIQGECLFCAAPVKTAELELYILRRAADLLPFERQRQQMLLEPAA